MISNVNSECVVYVLIVPCKSNIIEGLNKKINNKTKMYNNIARYIINILYKLNIIYIIDVDKNYTNYCFIIIVLLCFNSKY